MVKGFGGNKWIGYYNLDSNGYERVAITYSERTEEYCVTYRGIEYRDYNLARLLEILSE